MSPEVIAALFASFSSTVTGTFFATCTVPSICSSSARTRQYVSFTSSLSALSGMICSYSLSDGDSMLQVKPSPLCTSAFSGSFAVQKPCTSAPAVSPRPSPAPPAAPELSPAVFPDPLLSIPIDSIFTVLFLPVPSRISVSIPVFSFSLSSAFTCPLSRNPPLPVTNISQPVVTAPACTPACSTVQS